MRAALCLLLALAAPAGASGAPASQPASAPAAQPASAPSALEQELAAAIAADAAPAAAGRPAPAKPAVGSRGFQSLNPDISIIADMTGGWMQRSPLVLSGDDPAGTGFRLQELELAFSAVVDPYLRGDVFLTIPNLKGLEVEEAYVTSLSLPYNLQLRAGMMRAMIGRQNAQHLHVQDFTRRPQLNALLLGPDGFRAPGVELSWLAPTPFYAMAYAAAYSVLPPDSVSATARPTFGGGAASDLTYLGSLRLFFPLGEELSVYAGGVFVTGIAPSPAPPIIPEARSYLYGGDLYVKWKPANQAQTYLSLAWQTEFFARAITGHGTEGAGYSQLVLQLARRWSAGVRGEVLGLPRGSLFATGRGYVGSAALTFTASEFARLRLTGEGHWNDTVLATQGLLVKDFAVVLVQLEVSLGAHGAHPF